MVFGTCTTRNLPRDAFARLEELKQVSSPPMVMSIPTPRRSSVSRHLARSSGLFVGFAREMPSVEPPRKWMRLVSAMVRGVTREVSPSMSQRNPSWTPSTSTPERFARMVAAPITLLMPGAGPPPTRMASFSFVIMVRRRGYQAPRDAGKRNSCMSHVVPLPRRIVRG